MASACLGRIVWVEIVDPQGRNPKCRPAVIVTPTADITPDGVIHVVGISTRIDPAAAEHLVMLQWDPRGNCRTGLREASVAVCTWVQGVAVASIQGYAGMVPPRQLIEILAKVAKP